MEDRHVFEGVLGCPNCRDAFPVDGGFVDLRPPPRGTLPEGRVGEPGPVDEDETFRLAALLGVAEGPGTLALVGRLAVHAAGVAQRVEGVGIAAVDPDMARWPERERVSRLAAAGALPFFTGMLRGVAVDGALGTALVAEAARVTARLGRVVVVDAPHDAARVLTDAGMSVLVEEAGTLVAARG